jgi:glutamate-ammonia-ligase adenylyltransferase
MYSRKTSFSEKFIKEIAGWLTGYFSSDMLDDLFKVLQNQLNKNYFTDSSENNLYRILSATYDRVYLLKDTLIHPHYAEVLISLVSNSNYLTDIVVRNPEYLNWILNSDALNTKLSLKPLLKDTSEKLSLYSSFNSKLNLLKSIKRREILRTGLKDILGIQSLKETTSELSFLANNLTSILFDACFNEIKQKHQIKAVSPKYVLISLGKLGGNELNYSSDIDLILCYEKNTKISDKFEHFEFLNEVIYLFIESASSVTDAGYLYRVDFRLRPDGKNSPLCRSLNDTLNYYEMKGEDWERQMLIKAGYVCGEKQMYDYFINYLSPFIYPSSSLKSPVEQIRRLRRVTIDRLNTDHDIKLSFGGIRDIEFSVQALQLINVKINKGVKSPTTLEAIEKLRDYSLLTNEEAENLTKYYLLFRRIEHFLQLMNDLQTHTLPEHGEVLSKLSFFLNFKTIKDFQKELTRAKNFVKEFSTSLFFSENDESIKKRGSFEEINFVDKSRAKKNILFLREGKGLLEQRSFDQKTTTAFLNIEEVVEQKLHETENPDQILDNFVRIIKSSKFPSIWYEQLSNQSFADPFCHICEFSQYSINLFAEDPYLREVFLSGKVFRRLDDSHYNFSLKELHFILSIQLSLKILTRSEVSYLLSKYCRVKFNKLYADYFKSKRYRKNIFAAALGSFSSNEMTFFSDIDIIFISEGCEKYQNIQADFFKFFNLLKDEFTPHSVDSRLRPEGKTSIIIWDIKKYQEYIRNRMQTWELQAMTKLSLLVGNDLIYSNFFNSIEVQVTSLQKYKIKKDITDMRQKIYPLSIGNIVSKFHLKKSRGGITDIEFLIQFLLLCSPKLLRYISGKSIGEQINLLYEHSLINDDIKKLLEFNYSFLKVIEIQIQLILSSNSGTLPTDEKKLHIISVACEMDSIKEFQKKIDSITKSNYSLFQKLISGEI